MRSFKKILSMLLVVSLLLTVMMPVLSVQGAEADIPWDEDVAWGDMPSFSLTEPGQKYFTGNEWMGTTVGGVNNADVFGVNREEAHSSETIPYDSVEKAMQGAIDYAPELSDYYKLITGEGQEWQLAVYKNMTEANNAAGNFYKTDYSMDTAPKYAGDNTVGSWPNAYYGGFKSVTLPASWQTQGFDFPIYSNVSIPWSGVYGNAGNDWGMAQALAPTVTNPVGLYRYYLDVDESWMDANRKVFISFQGVESAMYLYVNGHEVGYTEDTFDAHDFDITPFLNADGKDNLIAVKVVRWCDTSFFEDQDYLRLAGIFRDVYVYSTPSVYLEDYKVETDLDENFVNANLSLDIDLSNMSQNATDGNFAVDVKLFDVEGKNVFEGNPLRGNFDGRVRPGSKTTLSLDRELIKPHLWSDEDPYLYTLVMTLYNSETGAYYESISQQLGVREITFTKTTVDANYNNTTEYYETVLLNGKRFMFRGTNRHDVNVENGRYVTKELYEKDILLMKQFNLNAIRTSHYPNDKYLYYLADKYGLYVLAECNIECHGTDSDGTHRALEAAAHDRAATHMQIEKNRTSVVMWSYGNESGNTPNSKIIQQVINNTMKPIDHTRPIHYCGLDNQGGVDVASQMYAGISGVYSRGEWENHMPYLQCEYAHAMGNSVGILKEYWDAYRSSDNILGAFVWDWVDQSIATEIPGVEGTRVLYADQGKNDLSGIMNGNIVDDAASPNGKAFSGNSLLSGDEVLNTVFPSNSFTIEAWVNQPNAVTTEKVIFARGDNQIALSNFGDRYKLYVKSQNGWEEYSYTLPEDLVGVWHHVAVTVDGNQMRFYLDGTELIPYTGPAIVGNVATVGNLVSATEHFGVGVLEGIESRNGEYKYAYVRVYDKALSAAELTAQMNADQGNGDYAYTAESDNVVMWMDYSQTTTGLLESAGVYDYYAEIGREDLAGKYLAYGGLWGDIINDNNFCMNGMISADRTVQDELYEVKYVYQKFWFTADTIDILNHTFHVKNESSITDLSAYDVTYTLYEDGVAIDEGKLDITCAPQGTNDFIIPFEMPQQTKADAEYYLTVSVKLAEDMNWAEAGHEIAYEQFNIPATVENLPQPEITGQVTKTEDADTVTLTGEKFSLEINKTTGNIENYTYDGNVVMTEGPAANYWRGAFDNEDGRTNRDTTWKNANNGMVVESLSVTEAEDGKSVTVAVDWNMPNAQNSEQLMTYTVYATGEIKVNSKLNPSAAMGELTKVGAEITLPRGYENITWYGNGPWETLSDRKYGGLVGVYESTVSDSFFPYPRPQASGIKTDVRYFAVEDPANPVGILVVSEDMMEASALHFSAKDYDGKKTVYQMPKTDYTILNVDMNGSRGTGGATCGPDTNDEYKLFNDGRDYSYSYTIVPYLTASADVMETAKLWRDAESFDEAEFNRQTADEMEALINTVAVILSYEQKEDIESVRTQYERLTDAQKALVDNYDVLTEAEEKVYTLYGAKAYMLDKSSYANHAEITGTATVIKDESSPYGYSFTGGFPVPDADNRINQALSGTNKFSIEFWVNPDDLASENGFVMKGDHQVSIKTTSTGLEFFVYIGGWDPIITVPFAQAGFYADQWNHVVATYDGAMLHLYVNNVLVGSTAYSGSVGSVGYPLGIGQNYDPGQTHRTLRGEMAGVHIYSTALTAAEVENRYLADLGQATSQIQPTDANVILWYDADGYKSEGGTTIDPPTPPAPPAPEYEMGDVDMNNKVDVADIMKLKALIMADKWSDDELAIGDMDGSKKLDVGDIMAVKNIIMSK